MSDEVNERGQRLKVTRSKARNYYSSFAREYFILKKEIELGIHGPIKFSGWVLENLGAQEEFIMKELSVHHRVLAEEERSKVIAENSRISAEKRAANAEKRVVREHRRRERESIRAEEERKREEQEEFDRRSKASIQGWDKPNRRIPRASGNPRQKRLTTKEDVELVGGSDSINVL